MEQLSCNLRTVSGGYDEAPKVARLAIRLSLDDLFEKSPDNKQELDVQIYEAYTEQSYTLTQIGKHLNWHC
jgi:hypothetical protein